MGRPYRGTVGQIYFEWFGRNAFVVDLCIVHDEYSCRARVLLATMVSAFKYCGIGLPNMVRAVAAIEGRCRVSVV